MYKVIIPKDVQKFLIKLNDDYYLRIRKKIYNLENNPRPQGCKKLIFSGEYRIRVGSYRILYEINDINNIR